MFGELMENVKERILTNMFRSSARVAALNEMMTRMPRRENHAILGQFANPQADREAEQIAVAAGTEANPASSGPVEMPTRQARPRTVRREIPKVGRNDPCPCGSNKKFKQCCGR